MKTPTLLVLTPTLGTSPFLEATVSGVQNLSLNITHRIVCPTPAMASLQSRFPHCQIVPDAGPAGGIYGALNAGLEIADAAWDWFTYINDDDELLPAFEKMATQHFTRTDPEPVVYGSVRRIDEKGSSLGLITTETNPKYLPAILHHGISPLNQQGMLFSRAVIEKLIGFDTRYKLCADLDFWVRAYAQGFPFRYYPMEVATFRIRSGQLSNNVDLTRRELLQITETNLPMKQTPWKHSYAKWRYRFMNLPRYIGRIGAVGFRSSEEVLGNG